MKTEIIINKFINLVDINKKYSLSKILKILNSVYLEETNFTRFVSFI